MLEEHINMVSDDAKQNVFHTKSGTTHLVHTHICIHTHTHTYLNQSRKRQSTCSWSCARGYTALAANQQCSRTMLRTIVIRSYTYTHIHTDTCIHTHAHTPPQVLLVDAASIGVHVFNEPGMGKDEGDANGGVAKVRFKSSHKFDLPSFTPFHSPPPAVLEAQA